VRHTIIPTIRIMW